MLKMEVVPIIENPVLPKKEIRRLNGLCNGAPVFGTNKGLRDLQPALCRLELPAIRFHDVPLFDGAAEEFDISRVFPLFHADVDDPRNYRFHDTDVFIERSLQAAGRLEYRLGESIDHRPDSCRVRPPADFHRWADICINIIRHCNEGWGGGMRAGIREWCIWEEPNTIPALFNAKSCTEFFPLYDVASQRIKQAFPELMIGGPAMGTPAGNLEASLQFLDYCRDHGCPLDFFSYTTYQRDPRRFMEIIFKLRDALDERGFAATRLNIAEWHYGHADWSRRWDRFEETRGINSGAYTASCLIGMQDAPVDMAYYYCCTSTTWGLFSLPEGTPLKSYFAYLAFAEMAKCRCRLEFEAEYPDDDVSVLAGEAADGAIMILVSCLKAAAGRISFRMGPEWSDGSMLVVDDTRNLESAAANEFVREPSGTFVITREQAGSAVYLLRFER